MAIPVQDGPLLADGPNVVGAAPPDAVQIGCGRGLRRRPRARFPVKDGPRRADRPRVARAAAPCSREVRRAERGGSPVRSVPVSHRPPVSDRPRVARAARPPTAERAARAPGPGERPLSSVPVEDRATETDRPDVGRTAAERRGEVAPLRRRIGPAPAVRAARSRSGNLDVGGALPSVDRRRRIGCARVRPDGMQRRKPAAACHDGHDDGGEKSESP